MNPFLALVIQDIVLVMVISGVVVIAMYIPTVIVIVGYVLVMDMLKEVLVS